MTAATTTVQAQAADKAEARRLRAEAAAKKAKKKKMVRNSGFVFLFLVSLVVWWGVQKPKGTIHVGICRTFLELSTRYPQTVKLTVVESADNIIRLYYIAMGSSGEYKSDMMECAFGVNKQTGALVLKSVAVNRMPVAPEKVQRFSATIPIIGMFNPDLTLPAASVKTGTVDLMSLWHWSEE